MTRVVVDAGICGFNTTVEVARLSARRVRITLTSDCEAVSKLSEELKELDWQDFYRQRGDSLIYKLFQCVKHLACPVPVAIFKAVEVEIGAALPRDVAIKFRNYPR